MQLELLNGYPDFVGRRTIWCGFGNGPASYQQATKDVIAFPRQTFYIDVIIPALSTNGTTGVLGTYIVYGVPIPAGYGPRLNWALKWVVAATGAEVGNGVSLANEVVQLGGFGGTY
jgi:hypothetical protein